MIFVKDSIPRRPDFDDLNFLLHVGEKNVHVESFLVDLYFMYKYVILPRQIYASYKCIYK